MEKVLEWLPGAVEDLNKKLKSSKVEEYLFQDFTDPDAFMRQRAEFLSWWCKRNPTIPNPTCLIRLDACYKKKPQYTTAEHREQIEKIISSKVEMLGFRELSYEFLDMLPAGTAGARAEIGLYEAESGVGPYVTDAKLNAFNSACEKLSSLDKWYMGLVKGYDSITQPYLQTSKKFIRELKKTL
jgi:hypothetical protein